jgi:signal transduction histidine kinase
MVTDVTDLMKFQMEQKGIHLEVKVSEDVPRSIFSDSQRIKQVLYNLVGNAIKFTYKGGVKLAFEWNKNTQELLSYV